VTSTASRSSGNAHAAAEATAGVYKRKKWETTRRAVLARDPICKVCYDALSTEVDHIIPLTQGGEPYRLDGLQGICSPCHWRKTGLRTLGSASGPLAAAAFRPRLSHKPRRVVFRCGR
jgi:5-methylcytosine-specific restriction enzyme A